jgi:hypothetical protein
MILHRFRDIVVFFMMICVVWGCGGGVAVAPSEASDQNEKVIRQIALMPVINKTEDSQAAQLMRKVLADELYFKGYPKIPITRVDDTLREIYGDQIAFKDRTIPPETLGRAMDVDAVFYCTLEEWRTSYLMIYAPTTVAASFELRSADTGETLWNKTYKVVKRDYGFTEKGLEMKSHQSCEAAAREVVEKAMAALPDGPEYPVRLPKEERSFFGLW